MPPSTSTKLSTHPRFPGEILSHAVWLYVRFPLSLRDGETRRFGRGVIVREACRSDGLAPHP